MKNKLTNLFKWGGIVGLALSPVLVAAQTITGSCNDIKAVGSIEYLLCRVSLILNTIVPILIILGVIYFIYGVISYAIAKDDEAKTSGRGAMINGLIALLVITSIWGLVAIMKNLFGDQINSKTIQVPCISGTINGQGVICP